MTDEIKKEKKPVGLKYVGNGKFITGISIALTLDEFLKFPARKQKHLVKLGIFEVIYD